MNVTSETRGHAVLLHLDGEVNEDALAALRRAVDRPLEGEGVIDLVLDMEKVPFVDSAALEYLLDLQERLSERLGQLRLARCGENVTKILDITRLRESLETFDDVAEAVRAMQA